MALYDVYTQVKSSEYRKLIEDNKSLLKENAELKAKLEKANTPIKSAETVENLENKKEIEVKKETKKGGK